MRSRIRGIGLAVATAALLAGGVALASTASAEEDGSCDSGDICLYTGALFTGNMLDLSRCTYVDLADKGWAGAIRSYDNRQSVGTVTTFYTTTPLGRQVVATSAAPERMTAFPQGVLVDGMQVC
ncbi:peptidase inhibitor family I36 protein [Streptomyces europaeiscabiei]|uniref:peptidase inhibitor family I36 protein n=1 Tax=Streptomyces europaeiscabiei TaxID=146819 RepID=UPI002E0DC7D0|nr:peptidase inhibitor family I36 protein [Streptomyces europaeiscabiei]